MCCLHAPPVPCHSKCCLICVKVNNQYHHEQHHNYCFLVADYEQEHCLHVNEVDQISLNDNNTDDGGEVEMEEINNAPPPNMQHIEPSVSVNPLDIAASASSDEDSIPIWMRPKAKVNNRNNHGHRNRGQQNRARHNRCELFNYQNQTLVKTGAGNSYELSFSCVCMLVTLLSSSYSLYYYYLQSDRELTT